MLERYFDTKKLELYVEKVNRGFVLLTVNEKHLVNGVIQLISKKRTTSVYDLSVMEFRDTVRDFEENQSVEAVVYYNFGFDSKQVSRVLEKMNLARDMLLTHSRLLFFVVPEFVEQIIQEDFPNLYSYFVLKESYLRRFSNYFEYILPGKKYLITKEEQHEFKKKYLQGDKSIDERLEYFVRARMSDEELWILNRDIRKYLEFLLKNKELMEYRYYFSLIIQYAKVLMTQEKYEGALETFNDLLLSSILKRTNINLYFEAFIGKGDTDFYLGKYEEALECYSSVMMENSERSDYEYIGNALKYQVKILSRIALCHAQKGNLQKANQFMTSAVRYAKEMDFAEDVFPIYYNFLLINMRLYSGGNFNLETVIHTLDKMKKNRVQEAMYLTIFAWYEGVMRGKCEEMLGKAKEALKIKREIYLENDLRIAESHYVIAVLYNMLERYEEARRCCVKSLNILKNLRYVKHQEKLSRELYKEILERQK